MSLPDFCAQLQTELANDLGFRFVPGMLEGPIEIKGGGWIGCVWAEDVREVEGDVQWEQLDVRVRIFKAFKQQTTVKKPIDPSELYAMGDSVRQAVKDKQAVALSVHYCRVTAIEYDVKIQGLEATVMAVEDNLFYDL